MNPLDAVLARPGEQLTQHTLNVVNQLRQQERFYPLLKYPDVYHHMRLAAWIHDSGKLAHGFQRQVTQKGFRWGLRHEVLSLAFCKWLNCGSRDQLMIALVIATHHRSLDFILDTYRRGTDRVETLVADMDAGHCESWYEWLTSQNVDLHPFTLPTAADIHLQLENLAAWQAETPFSQRQDRVELLLAHGMFTQADHSAAAGIELYPPAPLRLEVSDNLYRHQQKSEALGRASLVLTAPAGSGKTLAALLWAKDVDRQILYLLPYRASMNAMYAQIQQVAGHVGIQHGQALSVLYRYAMEDEYAGEQALQMARKRLNLARLNAYPVRVTSPHVLLRSMYGLSGFTATQAMLYGAVFIVDEIHAYQPERLAKILAMLEFFKQILDVRILMMTATLPGVIRTALGETLGELPYVRADDQIYKAFVRHRIYVEDGDLIEYLPEIVQQARQGQTVLITVNTVGRARNIAKLIHEHLAHDVLLLHGRFNGGDRWKIEQKILRLFGLNAQRSQIPIVVSTQVIEVSLNLDFDILHSDPAPLDALLQRFGRVNRQGRIKELAPVHVYTQPDGKEARFSVYDIDLIERTLALLQQHHGEAVEEANIETWLDTVYTDQEGWMAAFRTAKHEFEHAVLDELNPFEPADRWMRQTFDRLFDEVYVLPLQFEAKYQSLIKKNPIEAADLLVSMSWWQYKMLERKGQAWQEDKMTFVDRPYHPLYGLLIDHDDEE